MQGFNSPSYLGVVCGHPQYQSISSSTVFSGESPSSKSSTNRALMSSSKAIISHVFFNKQMKAYLVNHATILILFILKTIVMEHLNHLQFLKFNARTHSCKDKK